MVWVASCWAVLDSELSLLSNVVKKKNVMVSAHHVNWPCLTERELPALASSVCSREQPTARQGLPPYDAVATRGQCISSWPICWYQSMCSASLVHAPSPPFDTTRQSCGLVNKHHDRALRSMGKTAWTTQGSRWQVLIIAQLNRLTLVGYFDPDSTHAHPRRADGSR